MDRQPASKGKLTSPKIPGLKKLPAKKSATKKPARDKIVLPAGSKKYFSSIVELIKRNLPEGEESKMPLTLKPMLATLVDAPFTSEEWQFELKLDGYRTLAFLNKGSVEIRSRNENSFNLKFKPVYEALKEWNINAVVDGEIVVLNEEGRSDFNGIQQWDKKQEGQLIYYVFDIVWLEGRDLSGLPLFQRRDILRQLMPESGTIRYSDHIDDIGEEFFEIARKNNLEGIIAKRKDSTYVADARSKSWLKIKIEEQHEAIICGYSKNRNTDRLFSSLVLGIYKEGCLTYIGQSGTGFTEKSQVELMKKMRPLVTSQRPFEQDPKIGKTTIWVEPELVCEVKYTELTKEGIMRHPSFQGMRTDKTAADLNTESAQSTGNLLVEFESETTDLISTKKEEQLVKINDHELRLTNLKKIFWPATSDNTAISKGDLLRYYYQIADYIMPYMKDRP
ncbi:MAG: non-homologous end-joining DNA ligase, partial [Flavisolibacter sp.]